MSSGNSKITRMMTTYVSRKSSGKNYVLCDQKTIFDTETEISRHDLLAALIRDVFNWTNCFGQQVHLVKETAGVTENQYALRTLVFELKTPNAVLKTRNNQTTIVNNKVVN